MTIHFPDLSHYPDADPRTPGTQTLDLHDVVALITKATEGATYTDPTYTTYRDRARGKGIPFAGFHWLHASDVPGQARHAFAVVGPDVPLMIDDEDPDDGLSVARTAQFVREYRALGGLVTLEYLPRWFWAAHGSPSLQPLADLGLALVSSNYTTYSDTGPGWAPYGGMTPAIWQHTSSATLDGAVKVDMNAYRGSADELRALFLTGTRAASVAPGATTSQGDDMGVIAKGPDGQLYHCTGGFSHPITAQQAADIRYLAKQGVYQLATGTPGVEWTDGGQTRLGWTPAFGPVWVAPVGDPAAIEAAVTSAIGAAVAKLRITSA